MTNIQETQPRGLAKGIKLACSASVAVLAITASSCSDNYFNSQEPDGNTVIVASLNETEVPTRTCIDPTTYSGNVVGLLWHPNDSIGVYGASTVNSLFINSTTSRAAVGKFKGNMNGSDQPTAAYYPYSEKNKGRAVSDLLGTVPSEQTFSMSTGALSGDYKVGTLKSQSNGEYEFSFNHIFSMLKVSINATGIEKLEGERLEYITFEVANNRNITGDFHFNGETGAYSNVTGGGSSITMKWSDRPTLSANATYTGYITAIPEVKKGDQIKITVATENHTATFTVKSTVDYAKGYLYQFPLILADIAKNHEITVASRPVMTSFTVNRSENTGSIAQKKAKWSNGASTEDTPSSYTATIEGHDVNIMIPYLYNYKLKPTVAGAQGTTVLYNGKPLENGKTEIDFNQPAKLQVASVNDTVTYTVNVRNTGLPVVVINQGTAGSESWFGGIKLKSKSSDWVTNDSFTLIEQGKEPMTSAGGVKLRGNTTQKMAKKPLAVKLENKLGLLGLPDHKRWVLLANAIDHSMIRNLVAFTIAHATEQPWKGGDQQGMIWNPSGQNVELIIDGVFVGNYTLCEQIKIGSKRLAIKDCYADLTADGKNSAYEDCGFEIEFDDTYDEAYKGITKIGLPYMLKDDANSLPAQYWTNIQNFIQGIDDLIYNDRSKHEKYSEIAAKMDMNSVVDQWIVWELTLNHEYTDPRSVKYYINGGGSKLTAGPVWDFDRGTFQNPDKASSMGNTKRKKPYDAFLYKKASHNDYGKTTQNGTGLITKKNGLENDICPMWYDYLFQYAEFQQLVQKRWAQIYPYLLMVSDEIYALGEENYISWTYNNSMWPAKSIAKNYQSSFYDWSGDEDLGSYEEVIQNFVECYEGRLDGMNKLITNGSF